MARAAFLLCAILATAFLLCSFAESKRIYYPPKYFTRVDAEEEEADAEFLGKVFKKLGKIAVDAGKTYVGQKYGIQLDEEDEEEEADAEFLKSVLKKVGKVALQAGKAYLGAKTGIQLDEAEEDAEVESDSAIGNGATLEATTSVNIRNGPCTSNGLVGVIGAGQRVTYRGEERSGCGYNWYRIDNGWVATNYFREVGLANGATLEATTSVNIRNGPCTSNGLVGVVGAGQRVTYRGETTSGCGYTWYRIDNGWVASNYFNQVSGGGGGSVGGGYDCGESYTQGRATGRKQCVKIDGEAVTTSTAEAFNRMKAAAAGNGIHLKINSGFRTMAEQQYVYNCYITKRCNNGNLAAQPGYSNHQNGIALDINIPNDSTYNWLVNNASRFGFVRTVPSENWHWELRNSACNAFMSYSCR